MPQKVIKLRGINRDINEFKCSGESEELINLRQTIGGELRCVKNKTSVRNDVNYKHIYEHSFGNTSILIAIDDIGVLWIEEGIYLATEFAGKDVEITSAGNVLVIYCKEDNTQLVYKYENNRYEPYDIGLGSISAHVSYSTRDDREEYSISTDLDSISVEGINDVLLKTLSSFNTQVNYGLSGAAIVGCAYELEDGNEIWSTAFVAVSSQKAPLLTVAGGSGTITVYGLGNVTLNLTLGAGNYDGVKKINVYSTKPVLPYETIYNSRTGEYGIRKLSLEEANLHGQIMHYQGSITPKEGDASLKLSFGISLSAEAIMKVNAGCIQRVGNNISLNNRFHYFDSSVVHVIQKPTMDSLNSDYENDYWAGYVKINNEWKLIDGTFRFSPDMVNNFIYPMAGVKQLAFMRLEVGDTSIETYAVTDYDRVPSDVEYILWRDTDMFFVDMKDSSAYNYSYAFDIKPSNYFVESGSFYDQVASAGQLFGTNEPDSKAFLKKEFNAINVSAQFNPLVFPVEYSYSFSGEIKDVVTSYLPISSVQIGQYPITVFTSNGVFALEQGNGNVLYGNIVPLQPYVIDGKATSSPHGIFFISSKNIYLLTGRDAANISQVLNGNVESSIKELGSYKALCRNIFDFSKYLSNERFDEFINNATMTYDPLKDEMYICSNDENIGYSYVLNWESKSYHKVSKKYKRPHNGARYVLETTDGVTSVVDFNNEEESSAVPVLIQSRPITLEALYTHIQRMILHLDTSLSGDQYLFVSVFGSDNLHDWKCISSAQKVNTVLRHIRTNKSPKSYKDYVILINGVVGSDTDISDLIADYTVVNRRLG